jgi:hypothetical protein
VPSTILRSYPWAGKTARRCPLPERNAETFTNGRLSLDKFFQFSMDGFPLVDGGKQGFTAKAY